MDLRQLVSHLAEERNLDFRGYKSSSLERRFRHRMFQVRITGFDEYARYIEQHPGEVTQLLNTVLINVTAFFRDPQAWAFLREKVLPEIAGRLQPGESLRVWSAGCASGEETYSLCMLLAEHFGTELKRHDVKVYGTDIDEHALALARRAEYSADKLKGVPEELREKYFTQVGERYRMHRELRRLAIFGRSNLALDAPISHVHLLVCRNVLIYFDSELQRRILKRLHYALVPDGLLMLGKAETQLSQSSLFAPVHPKWRVFRRLPGKTGARQHRDLIPTGEDLLAKARNDYALLKTLHENILETIEPGILVLDTNGVIISENEAAGRLWGITQRFTGRKFEETELPKLCPELKAAMDGLASAPDKPRRFEANVSDGDGRSATLAVTVKTIKAGKGTRAGLLIYIEDVTPRQKLQQSIEELETTGEELQSTNEELETTNEELQSTNEELETTNEELQSTNEELETTNEELQALNEELGTTNEELEARTSELDAVNERYSETLERMPWPVLLVNKEEVIQFWNGAAQRAFGLGARSIVGLELDQLPLQHKFRSALIRHYRDALVHRRPRVHRNIRIDTNTFAGEADIHFTPLGKGPDGSVLIIIEPAGTTPGPPAARKAQPQAQPQAQRAKKLERRPATRQQKKGKKSSKKKG